MRRELVDEGEKALSVRGEDRLDGGVDVLRSARVYLRPLFVVDEVDAMAPYRHALEVPEHGGEGHLAADRCR